MTRFLKILFYGALTIGIFAFYYLRDDRVKVEVEHVYEHRHSSEHSSDHEETYEVIKEGGDFHSLDIHGNFEVFISQGSHSEYKIESEHKVKDRIRTEINNGVLKIYTEKMRWKDLDEVQIFIEAPTYRKIGVHGAVSLKSQETLNVEDLEVAISGAGEAKIDLNAEELEVKISGAGEVKLSGNAEDVDLAISGAGEIKAYDLVAEELKVSISGAGDAKVHATEELDVRVSGAGNVQYKGSPKVNKRISGFGNVKAVN